MARSLRLQSLVALLALVGASACRVRESPEDVRTKARKHFLETQIDSLQELVGRAERGELTSTDRIAIGVDEAVAREILNTPLPLEQVLGGRVRIRIEQAEPLFRGNQPALVFRARATSEDLPNQYADLELGGVLRDLALVEGRLAGKVELVHFVVTKGSVGPLALGVVENLIRANLALLASVLPPFEIPVRLEPQLRLARFDEGPVSAAGGELPFSLQLAEVIAVNQRLWVLIEAKAGPWKSVAAPAAPPARAAPGPQASPTGAGR